MQYMPNVGLNSIYRRQYFHNLYNSVIWYVDAKFLAVEISQIEHSMIQAIEQTVEIEPMKYTASVIGPFCTLLWNDLIVGYWRHNVSYTINNLHNFYNESIFNLNACYLLV